MNGMSHVGFKTHNNIRNKEKHVKIKGGNIYIYIKICFVFGFFLFLKLGRSKYTYNIFI
jgi:hypothetical protein